MPAIISRSIVCCLLFATVIPAAGAEETESKALFPYKLGAEWIYESRSTDENGAVTTEKATSRVEGVHLFGDQRWYYVYEFDYGFWVRNTVRGAEEADVELDEETLKFRLVRPHLFFKYPVKKGEQYKIDKPYIKSQMRIAEVDEEIKVPAGTFNCVNYELIEEGTVVSRMWLAPGVGLVKFHVPQDPISNTPEETLELVKLTVASGMD